MFYMLQELHEQIFLIPKSHSQVKKCSSRVMLLKFGFREVQLPVRTLMNKMIWCLGEEVLYKKFCQHQSQI